MAVALLATANPVVGQSRAPVTLEALLGQESLGQVRISPDGRWIVVERRAAWSAAATYRFGLMTPHLLSGLDIHTPAGALARRLEDPGHASGYVSGPFSPSGEKMLVVRLRESSRTLGVMTLATGAVRWLPLTPEFTELGRTVAWRSETQLVAIARPDGDLPLVFRLGSQTEARKTGLWRAFAAGHAPSAVVIPSGAARDSRDRSAGARLVLFDLARGEERVLARGDLFDLELSTDGGAVAALLNAEDLQVGGETPVDVGTPSRRRRLLLVDLDQGTTAEPLPDQDFLSHLLSWSPDSRRLIAFARDAGAGAEWADGRFWIVARRGAAEPLPLGEARPWLDAEVGRIPIARAGWSAGLPVAQVRTARDERLWLRTGPGSVSVPVVEPRETLVEVGRRTWIERADGLHPFDAAPATPGRLWDRERAADGGSRQNWNPDGVQRGRRGLVGPDGCLSVPSAPAARTCPAPLAADETLVAVSPMRDYLIAQRRTPGGSTSLRLHAVDGTRPLVTVNTAFDALAWGTITPIAHAGPEGQALTSWLLLPPGVAPNDRVPVVVIVYPGAAYAAAPAWLRPGGERLHINPAVLAAAGYAVLVPSLPRPAGAGPQLDDLAERIGAIIDAAAVQAPIDPGRVGLVGHSYGGYGVLLAASQSDRFRAVVAAAGYADLSRVYALPPHFLVSPDDGVPINALVGWAETGQGAIGASLLDQPQAYVAGSPLYVARRIRTPTLLIEGDLDPAGGDVLFGALYRLGREAALVTYAGEGHVFVSPANLRDLHARILDWLDRHVRPADVGDPRLPASGPDLQHGADQ
ncbi:MAG: prolyl oligopeptidase family serine peptidase [Phenylobacterium sp.]|nr:prolyl oligopeptidase family serine peptidase [Phenylobacterium sp.]